jgi:hypothetical protein
MGPQTHTMTLCVIVSGTEIWGAQAGPSAYENLSFLALMGKSGLLR